MQQHTMRLLATFGFGMALASCLGPIEPTPNHCFNQDGNDFCAEKYGDERRFCGTCDFDIKDGCTAERPAEASCYSPCGEGKSLEEDPECEGVAEGSSSSDSVSSVESTVDPSGDPTTEPTGTMTMTGSETESSTVTATGPTTDGGCVTSSECVDPLTPICEDMVCVACTDAPVPDDACAEKGAGTPVCRDDGACVACTPANAGACEGTTPVCDGATNECGPCGFHEQCPGTACEIATGACFSDACVVEVDGDGGADYEDIQDAVMDGCVVIVHELDGAMSYQEAVSIEGVTVAILGADGEDPVIQGVGGNPALTVSGGASAHVQDLAFRNSPVEGVVVDGANVYLDRTEVTNNTGGGIALTSEAIGQLRNCFVGGNIADVAAIDVTDGATTEILYTTILAADQFGDGAALHCTAPGTVDVRNSLLAMIGAPAEVQCAGATFTTSATESGASGTVPLGNVMPSWFVNLTNNFALNNPPAGLLNAAEWHVGDPATDIGGAPRPAVDGSPDAAGADLP